MIVLDTNVVTELMKPAPDATAAAWVSSRREDVCITAITVGEIIYGLERLPEGRRRRRLEDIAADILDGYSGLVLDYTASAAAQYGVLAAHRAGLGRPIGVADGQIAAICRAHRARCATRNTKDFEHTGIDVINPWRA